MSHPSDRHASFGVNLQPPDRRNLDLLRLAAGPGKNQGGELTQLLTLSTEVEWQPSPGQRSLSTPAAGQEPDRPNNCARVFAPQLVLASSSHIAMLIERL